MGSIRVIVPSVDEIPLYWADVKPLVESTLPYSGNEHSLSDIKLNWESSRLFFILFYRNNELIGICSVEAVHFPQKTILNMPHVAGKDFDEWLDVGIKKVNELAKQFGCTEIRSCGREGWTRKLKDHKFKHQYTILSRAVE